MKKIITSMRTNQILKFKLIKVMKNSLNSKKNQLKINLLNYLLIIQIIRCVYLFGGQKTVYVILLEMLFLKKWLTKLNLQSAVPYILNKRLAKLYDTFHNVYF